MLTTIGRQGLAAVDSWRSASVSERDLEDPGLVDDHRGFERRRAARHLIPCRPATPGAYEAQSAT
jgi:hypothetical protein